jgi:hypothetical protein
VPEEKKRKRPGPKPSGVSRTKVIGLRVTRAEYDDLVRQRGSESLTDFLRRKLGLSNRGGK